MPKLGLSTGLHKSGLTTPGIVTSNLVLKHNYSAGGVIPVSDGAAFFDGTDDYIDCGDISSIEGEDDISLGMWVKYIDTNPQSFMSKGSYAASGASFGGYYTPADVNGGRWRFSIDDGLFFYNNNSLQYLPQNQWNHIVVTYSNTNDRVFFYFNGLQISPNTTSGTFKAIPATSHDLYIGRDGSNYGNQLCANAFIYKKELTQPEVKSIMNKNYSGLTSSETTSLVSWWNLDTSYSSSDGDTNVVFDNHHSGGESLGSEMVIDGSFDNNSTSWTTDVANDTTVTVSNNVVTMTNSGTTGYGSVAQASTDFVDGNYYKLTFDVTALTTSDSVTVYNYNSNLTKDLENVTTPVTITDYFLASNTDGVDVRAVCSNGESITIDNISVKQVNGNTGTLT